MKKNTLVEVLVVFAILGILFSVVLASFNSAKEKGIEDRCDKNLTADCPNYKTSLQQAAQSTGDSVLDYDTNYCDEETAQSDYGCGCVTNPDEKKQCEDEGYRSQMVQECINKYLN